MALRTKNPNPAKDATIKEFAALIDSWPYIGVVNMENLPARQLQTMRASLREKGIVLKMTKARLIKKAFAQSSKPGIEQLAQHFRGMPALIFTKENPFALFKLLKKSQSKAPIKAGQTAPDDIIVPAGPTSFAPGPIIGELGSVGVKAGIEDGKVAIKQDSKVASAGDVISAKLAGLLTRLGIEPMRIGLDLLAVYEDGEILTRDVLDIDEEQFLRDLTSAHSDAFALAMSIAYATEETVRPLLQQAFMDAVTLALERGIVNGETIRPLMGKAYAAALAVSGLLPNEALGEEAAAAVAPAEEKPEDPKPEQPAEQPAEKTDTAAGLGALFG